MIQDLYPSDAPVMPERKAKAIAVNLDSDELRKLGAYMADLVSQGQSEKVELLNRWERNWNQYHSVPEPFVSQWMDGVTDIGFPFSKPRSDTLQDAVTGMIFGADPVVSVVMASPGADDSRAADKIEDVLTDWASFVNLEEFSKRLATQAFVTNHGLCRLDWDKPRAMPVMEPVLAENFICVGSAYFDFHDSICVGHSFTRFRRDYDRMVSSGEYHDHDVDPPSVLHTLSQGSIEAQAGGARHRQDEPVELWELVFRLDLKHFLSDGEKKPGEEEWYVATVEPEGKKVCRLQEYPYERPMYFNCAYKVNTAASFWTPHSIASDLQGSHTAYNGLMNLMMIGTAYSALPVFASDEIPEDAANKTQIPKPGQWVDAPGGVNGVQNQFDANKVMMALQTIERQGDMAARINQGGMGQEFSKQMTATEAEGLRQSQQAGIGGYAATFSFGLVELCYGALEMIKAHSSEYLEANGDRLGLVPDMESMLGAPEKPISPDEVFEAEVMLEITGRNPNVSPQAVIANLQMLLSLEPPMPPAMPGMPSPQGLLNRAEIIKEIVSQLRLTRSKDFINEPQLPTDGGIAGMGGLLGALQNPAGQAGQGPIDDLSGLATGSPAMW